MLRYPQIWKRLTSYIDKGDPHYAFLVLKCRDIAVAGPHKMVFMLLDPVYGRLILVCRIISIRLNSKNQYCSCFLVAYQPNKLL